MESNSVTTQPKPEGVFERVADWLSNAIGMPAAFMLAAGIVLVWALLGPAAGFSNTWQLIINTGTTIVTFLMVFLLGNASNRITENQERMLDRIYTEQERMDAEERLVKALLERIDRRHIGPIMRHLDKQDRQIDALTVKILEVLPSPD